MEKQDMRIANLRAQRGGERGDIKAFAEAHDLNDSYLSQLLNKHRSLGEKAARKLEKQIGLPPGFLDEEPGTQNSNDPMSRMRCALGAIDWLDSSIKEGILRTLEELRPKQ
jgi:transcriptional regulator with XRE-family HTH domain